LCQPPSRFFSVGILLSNEAPWDSGHSRVHDVRPWPDVGVPARQMVAKVIRPRRRALPRPLHSTTSGPRNAAGTDSSASRGKSNDSASNLSSSWLSSGSAALAAPARQRLLNRILERGNNHWPVIMSRTQTPQPAPPGTLGDRNAAETAFSRTCDRPRSIASAKIQAPGETRNWPVGGSAPKPGHVTVATRAGLEQQRSQSEGESAASTSRCQHLAARTLSARHRLSSARATLGVSLAARRSRSAAAASGLIGASPRPSGDSDLPGPERDDGAAARHEAMTLSKCTNTKARVDEPQVSPTQAISGHRSRR